MKIIKTAILTIAAAVLSLSGGVAVAADAEGSYTVSGLANFSCASFLKEDKEDGIDATINKFWIGGFMTAAGVYNDTQKSFGKAGVDIDGIMHLIRDYCDENPLDQLVDAANYVVSVHLLPKAGYR